MISTFGAFSSRRSAIADHLLGRLAFGEDHFGHAVAQRAMVVDFGEAQDPRTACGAAFDGRVDIYCAGAHLFEQRAEMVLIHDARISEAPRWLLALVRTRNVSRYAVLN